MQILFFIHIILFIPFSICHISNELESFIFSQKTKPQKIDASELHDGSCDKTKNINYEILKFIENFSIHEQKRHGYRILFDRMRFKNDTNTIEFMMLTYRVHLAKKRYPKDEDLKYIQGHLANHILNFPWDNNIRIKNIKFQEYLSSPRDELIRNGKTRDVTSTAFNDCYSYDDNDDAPCLWKITPKSYETFGIRLLNPARGEILYASDGRKMFDSSKRNVYLDSETHFNLNHIGGDTWMFEPIDGTHLFRIYNLYYCEQLYFSGDYFNFDVDRRRMYTWRRSVCSGRACKFLIEKSLQ